MSFQQHREQLKAALPDKSIVVSYAGIPVHTNEDDAYSFEVNSQYFYLTGIERAHTALVMLKSGETLIGESQIMLQK